MQKRAGVVTFKGAPVTLTGARTQGRGYDPAVTLTGVDFSAVNPLEPGAGKPRLFINVPSVDTSVCSLESKKFSEVVKVFGDSIAVYVISADLPFALRRWCAAEGVECSRIIAMGSWERPGDCT
jgi:thioredoxin-dependent peroxiredoxin